MGGRPHHRQPGPAGTCSFDAAFWALLPAFVFVTLVGAIETIGDSVAIQRVSWRKLARHRLPRGAGRRQRRRPRQPALRHRRHGPEHDVFEQHRGGGAHRRRRPCRRHLHRHPAFWSSPSCRRSPPCSLPIPGPVAAAYLLALLSMLFVLGMKIVVQDGLDYRKGAIVGISFWIGVGFQNQAIFAEQLGAWWGALLGNGMTAGGLTAVVLSVLLDLSRGRRSRMETQLSVKELPVINEFLATVASRARWGEAGTQRLCAAAEETVLSLMDHHDSDGGPPPPAGHRPRRPRGRRPRVHRRLWRRQPRRPHGPRRRTDGSLPRTRRLPAPPAPFRQHCPPPAIPRRRHRDDSGGATFGVELRSLRSRNGAGAKGSDRSFVRGLWRTGAVGRPPLREKRGRFSRLPLEGGVTGKCTPRPLLGVQGPSCHSPLAGESGNGVPRRLSEGGAAGCRGTSPR